MASVVAAWPMVALGAVAVAIERPEIPVTGKMYRQIGVRLWGVGAYEREPIDGGETQYKTLSRVETDDIIVNKIWARNGSVSVVAPPLAGAYVSGEFPTFVPIRERLLPDWFKWLTKTRGFWEQCDEMSRGTSGKNRIRPERFLEIPIPLPPLDEQRRIVARIEALAARIAEAQGLRRVVVEEARAMWRSALSNAFMTDGDIQTSVNAARLLEQQAVKYAAVEGTNYNGAHPWKPNIYQEGLYPIPSSWVWTNLGSVLTHFVDCVNDTPDFSPLSTEFLGLKSTNIRPYKLDLAQRWFVTEEIFLRWNRRIAPQSRDLVMTREAPMGNVCMIPEGVVACLTQRLMLLRSDVDFVRPRYLLHFLNSPHFQSQVLEQCRGLTTPHIRVKDAPLLKVPLPPQSIQDNIVTYLDETQTRIDALKRAQAETEVELDAQLPSILDRAFRGEL